MGTWEMLIASFGGFGASSVNNFFSDPDFRPDYRDADRKGT